MAKFMQILLIASIALALCAAEAPLRRNSRFRQQAKPARRNRFLARQELAEEEAAKAVTPYPTADELKPAIAFEDGEQAVVDGAVGSAEAAEPAIAEDEAPDAPRTPDNTYGPPEYDLAAAPRTPDNTYGPPEFDAVPAEDAAPAADEDDEQPIAADIPAVDAEVPAVGEQEGNSVEQAVNDENADVLPEPAQPARLTAAGRRRLVNRARPAKLRAAPKLRTARLQQQVQKGKPIFFYTAQHW